MTPFYSVVVSCVGSFGIFLTCCLLEGIFLRVGGPVGDGVEEERWRKRWAWWTRWKRNADTSKRVQHHRSQLIRNEWIESLHASINSIATDSVR